MSSSRRPALRPWHLGLAGVGLFLAGAVLGAILVLSLTLYHLPPPTDPPTVSPVPMAALSPSPARPTPTPSGSAPTPLPTALPPTSTPSPVPVAPAVGRQAPSFRLGDLAGTEHDLNDYRGRVVVVNFWASWCPPCREEWPELEAFVRQADSTEVVVLAVNVEEPDAIVADFVGEASPLLVLLDRDGAVSDLYRVTALPTTFLLDAEGIVRQVLPGPLSAADLERLTARYR